jgi:hypothetical protein
LGVIAPWLLLAMCDGPTDVLGYSVFLKSPLGIMVRLKQDGLLQACLIKARSPIV